MDQNERYCYNPTLLWNPQVEEYFSKAYGADAFSRISKALTRPSRYSCIRVNTLRSTTIAVIEEILEIIKRKKLQNNLDKLHKTDDSESIIGHKRDGIVDNMFPDQSDAALEITGCDHSNTSAETCPVFKCPIPGLDYVIFVRGSGPHDIQYAGQQGRPPKEVIVSRKCAEAVLRGAQVYVPGVLACSAHVEKGDMIAVSVGVEKLGRDGGWSIGITRGTVLQGLETDTHYLERNGLYIGQGIAMMSRAGVFRELSGVAVDMTDRVFRLESFNDPQEGERILDMCAAPGGKTTAIAFLMKDKGEVIAVDRSHNKVLEIQNLAAELGLNSIVAYKLDALKAVRRSKLNSNMACPNEDKLCLTTSQDPHSVQSGTGRLPSPRMQSMGTAETANTIPTLGEVVNPVYEQVKGGRYTSKSEIRKQNRRMKNGPGRNQSSGGRVDKCEGFSPNSFDRVLLDAPCSALGLRPRLFAAVETVESMRAHAKYQKRMFDQAVQLVRSGGVIVYSTCTINPGENEALVRYALDNYKFLSLAPQHPRVGGPGLLGHYKSSDGYFEEWLRPGEEDLVQRFDPSSPLDTIGFFIAKFNVGQRDI